MTVSGLGMNTQVLAAAIQQAASKSSGSKPDKLGSLGPDVMAKIAGFLSPKDVARAERVSKSWNTLNNVKVWKAVHKAQQATPAINGTATAQIYKLAFSNPCPSIAFGPAQWNRYFGDVGQVPPLPADIHQILKSPCPFDPTKKVEETHMLVLVPRTVDGKPLTLKSLGELIKNPKNGGHKTQYRNFSVEEHADTPVGKSHWVLMTKNLLEGSRHKTLEKQQALIEEHSKASKAPYQMPNAIDAAVSILDRKSVV
jgi:hypothetical protein